MGTMLDCGPTMRELLTRLASPVRNRYYYSKLLDVYHLELEQNYGNLKRWLLNRLSLGSGVLCGLEVIASADGSRARVRGGVAIDGWGREIIVPTDSPPVDPRQPTDACGRPAGEPIRGGGVVTLWLCYHECEAEPSPVMVSECPDRECENGLIRERYRLRITPGQPAPPGSVTGAQCATIFAEPPPNVTRRTVVCETLDGPCTAPDEDCVPLATITLNDDGRVTSIDNCTFRRVVYSNAVLLDLILCLAERVDECCGTVAVRRIEIVSGDNQAGPVNQPLPKPLIARVMEGTTPRANEPVTSEVIVGGGAIGGSPASLGSTFTTNTAADGTATLPVWQLGPAPGDQRVTARIATGAPAMVTFRAKAERVAVTLPVVRTIWPPTAVTLTRHTNDALVRQWWGSCREHPRIELTFNKRMQGAQLGNPDPWLRVFFVRFRDENAIEVGRLPIAHAGISGSPMLPEPGAFCEVYEMREIDAGEFVDTRILTLIRAESGNILDTDTPALLLDADFRGTKLTPARFEEIWKVPVNNSQGFGQDVWDALVDTGATLPQSGNGSEGGRFESWFEFARA